MSKKKTLKDYSLGFRILFALASIIMVAFITPLLLIALPVAAIAWPEVITFNGDEE